MSWLAAAGFVASGWLLIAAAMTRRDPRVEGSLRAARLAGPGPLGAIGTRFPEGAARARVEARLGFGASAEAVDRVMGAKVALAFSGMVVGSFAWRLGGAAAAFAAVLATAGFLAPDFWLARRLRVARARASASVPDLLDVVSIAVTAGLTPRLALDRASLAAEGLLGRELALARDEVALGAPWRSALRHVAVRTGLREVRRLAATMERAERLGTPLAEPLRQLAREVRSEGRARDEERARRAPVMMLFPLVFCILPAFVVAALIPAVVLATRTIQ